MESATENQGSGLNSTQTNENNKWPKPTNQMNSGNSKYCNHQLMMSTSELRWRAPSVGLTKHTNCPSTVDTQFTMKEFTHFFFTTLAKFGECSKQTVHLILELSSLECF